MNNQRTGTGVVITGIGLMTPLALSIDEWVQRCSSGLVLRPDELDGDVIPFHRFDPKELFGRGYKFWLPATQYALATAQQAVADAALPPDVYGPEQAGVSMGTNFAVYDTNYQFNQTINSTGADDLSPAAAPNFSVNIPASTVSIKLGYRAFNITCTTACVAGLQAIDIACQALQRGRAEMALAGAVEGRPPRLSDRDRRAPVLAGGACLFVLERAEQAVHRGARIYGEVGAIRSCFLPLGSGGLAIARELLPPVLHDLSSGERIDGIGAFEGFTLSPLLTLAHALATRQHGLTTALGPEGHFVGLRTQQVRSG